MGSARTRPPDYLQEVGRRVRMMRLALGKSPSDMCLEMKVSRQAWSQWENGKRLFDILIAVRLKERHGVPLDWLYAGDPAGLPPWLVEWARFLEC